MRKGWKLLVLLLAWGLLAPTAALAQDDAEEAGADSEGASADPDASVSEEGETDPCEEFKDDPMRLPPGCVRPELFTFGLSGSLSAGLGSFVANEYARRTRVRYRIGMSASFTVPEINVNITLSTGFSQWLTEGGGSQTVQEFRWGDGRLSFSRQIYTIPVAKIGISGSLGFTLPISTFSRTANLYTTISPSLSFFRQFGPVNLSYAVGASWSAYESTSVSYNPSEVDILSRNGGNEVLASDRVAAAGILPEWSLFNSFSISYLFLDQFSLSLSFTFSDAWSHDNGTNSSGDEFTPTVRDSNGELVADVGRGHSQGTSGSLALGYAPLPFLFVSLSLSSSQPWKTADNQGFRFPFFDFESPANNFTWMALSVSGRY